jgi:2-polyprenyl-3-methyl-5-hydroxy-6-metoxy-1,4-benzoquinol methylase
VISACPLCRSAEATPLESYPFDDIWAALLSQWGVAISAEVRAAHAPEAVTRARRCSKCGLEWFAPAVPGDAQFYHELMRATPYDPDRWEFGLVASALTSGDHVVDLGCGDGGLIRRIDRQTGRAIGVDTNQDAIERLVVDGYEGSNECFETFAAREPGAFDVVCAFQIAEHLADVDELLAPARALLRPDGRLYLSVPNRERAARGQLESLDLPPHHLSRWARPQLEALGSRRGFSLLRVTYAPAMYGDVVQTVEARLRSHLPRRVARIARRLLLGPRRHSLFTRLGAYERCRLRGHTMLAEYRRNG